MQPRQILAALADLAPAAADRVYDVTRGGQPLVRLDEPERAPANREVNQLAALEALHREERILRRGRGWIVGGSADDGSSRRKVRVPLLSQPVRLERTFRGYRVTAAGDIEVSPLIEDRTLAALLESGTALGTPARLAAVARSAGFAV